MDLTDRDTGADRSGPEAMRVVIDYVYGDGSRRLLTVVPEMIYFGIADHFTTPQWLMVAQDVEGCDSLTLALRDIRSWDHVGSPDVPLRRIAETLDRIERKMGTGRFP